MTFSTALCRIMQTAEAEALTAELGELTHAVIELEAGRVCIPQAFVIGLIKLRMDEIRAKLAAAGVIGGSNG